MDTLVSLLALLIAVVALVFALVATRRTAAAGKRRASQDDAAADLPDDIQGLRHEVSALRLENAEAMKHLAVVRYDAFGDMGGHLSWSLALLDDHGDGVVLTSIHGRSDSRTYAKGIRAWSSDAQLSPEEEDAISRTRAVPQAS